MRKIFLSFFCAVNSLSGLEIELRYDLDTSGFFDQPGAKEAMEAATEFYEDLIVDELEGICPDEYQVSGTFERTWTPTYTEPDEDDELTLIASAENMVVPEDTLIVFVGARDLSTTAQGGPGGVDFGRGDFSPFPWLNQLVSRGEEGAATYQPNQQLTANPTDFAPWGGTVFFDSGSSWNFSTTTPGENGGIDFVSIALHELGHVLGIGSSMTPLSSWMPLIAYDSNNFPFFNGPLASLSHGQNLYTFDFAHWSQFLSLPTLDSPTQAAFGRSHGEFQRPLMLPVTSTIGASEFVVPTDLDIAALQDIGWEIRTAPAGFTVEVEFEGSQPQIEIPTTTGVDYTINRSEELSEFSPEVIIVGDGTVQTWVDPHSDASRAFYQLEVGPSAIALDGAKSEASPFSPKKKSLNLQSTEEQNAFIPTAIPPDQCACGAH